MTDVGRGYAFPHADGDESRRLRLLEERLDATTGRRMERLGLASSVLSLEVGAGRSSIARWLCGHVGPGGPVTGTHLETDFLAELSLRNQEELRHNVDICPTILGCPAQHPPDVTQVRPGCSLRLAGLELGTEPIQLVGKGAAPV